MVRPGRDQLSGGVAVDETVLGGPEPGRPGRGALAKTLVAVAVEREERTFGRCRLRVIADASAPVLRAFLLDAVEPSSTVITGRGPSYPSAYGNDYVHEPVVVSGSGHEAHELLPAVHRVASLLKGWLEGTRRGGVQPAHLQAYLDEFCFRFNRRSSRSRGLLFYRLLELAVAAGPHTYAQIISGTAKPKEIRPMPPAGPRRAPPSLAIVPVGRPWRR